MPTRFAVCASIAHRATRCLGGYLGRMCASGLRGSSDCWLLYHGRRQGGVIGVHGRTTSPTPTVSELNPNPCHDGESRAFSDGPLFVDLLTLLPDPTLPECPLLILPFSLPFPPTVSRNRTGLRSPRSSSFIMSGEETCIVPGCGSGFFFHGESRFGVGVPVGVNPSDVCELNGGRMRKKGLGDSHSRRRACTADRVGVAGDDSPGELGIGDPALACHINTGSGVAK